MAYNAMVTGVMLTPVKGYEHTSHNCSRGETSNGDGMEKCAHELKLELKLPLIKVLDNIFSLHGRVIIDFPGASHEQVSA